MPNMYTVLVGRSGIGKGGALHPAMQIVKKAGTANILSDRITVEWILERLSKGFPSVQPIGGGSSAVQFVVDSTCLISAPEFSVFAKEAERSLPDLTDLWDSNEGKFMYGTRGKGLVEIDSPCPTVLGGSTQEWLVDTLPGTAAAGGFTRRVNFVYAKDKEQDLPWPVARNGTNAKETELVEDLKHISATLRGRFQFHPDAKATFERIYLDSKPDEFLDEVTALYITSKWVHVTKLAMILSVCQRDDLTITKDDLEKALLRIDRVIEHLKLVFRAVGDSEMIVGLDKVLRFLEIKGYASRQEIMQHNWRHFSSASLDVIMATLTESNMVTSVNQGTRVLYKLTAHGQKTLNAGGVP